MSKSLAHHGVKGQQWGVRNGPPYPIDHTVMKKGTRLNSVAYNPDSERYKKNASVMYTYNPKDKHDSMVYKGPFSYYKMMQGQAWMHEHEFETVKDLKMPTKKERISAFVQMYSEQPAIVSNDLATVQKRLVAQQVGNEKERAAYSKFKPHSIKTEDDIKTAYSIFNHAMETAYAYRSTSAYMKYMSTKYDAMVDDNNQGVYNDAHDPVIVFRPNESLKVVNKARRIPYEEVSSNIAKLRDKLNKPIKF